MSPFIYEHITYQLMMQIDYVLRHQISLLEKSNELPSWHNIQARANIGYHKLKITFSGLDKLPNCLKVRLIEEPSLNGDVYRAEIIDTGQVIGYCNEPNVHGIAMITLDHRMINLYQPIPVVVVDSKRIKNCV